MLEIALCVSRGKGIQGLRQGVVERLWGACLRFTQGVFDFGPGQLDGIKVWRIGRQIANPRAGRFNEFHYPVHLVRPGIIYHHYVAGFQQRTEKVLQRMFPVTDEKKDVYTEP